MDHKLEILGPHNWDKYNQWYAKAMAEPDVRRFLSISGYISMAEKSPIGDWDCLLMIRGDALIQFYFDRSPLSSIKLSAWAVGDKKEWKMGAAMVEASKILPRYSYMHMIRSCCASTNTASLKLHHHLFGNPWGTEPSACIDEMSNPMFVDLVCFAMPVKDFIKKNIL